MKTKQPRKKRKLNKIGKMNIARKNVGAHLSKSLREKHGIRTLGLHVGDMVKIMRGKFSGKTGKVERVDMKKSKIFIEGIQIQKVDGTKAKVAIHPSNLLITDLNLTDKFRKKIIERKRGEKK